jgi:hypothetical protein
MRISSEVKILVTSMTRRQRAAKMMMMMRRRRRRRRKRKVPQRLTKLQLCLPHLYCRFLLSLFSYPVIVVTATSHRLTLYFTRFPFEARVNKSEKQVRACWTHVQLLGHLSSMLTGLHDCMTSREKAR